MQPPYRLTNFDAVQAFARQRPGQQDLLRFARTHRVEPHPILGELPERWPVPVRGVRLRRQVPGDDAAPVTLPPAWLHVGRVAARAPASFAEAAAQVVASGREYAPGLASPPNGVAERLAAAALDLPERVAETLAGAFRSYLHARSERARAVVSDGLLLLALYRLDPGPPRRKVLDRELLAALAGLGPGGTLARQPRQVLERRVERLARAIFHVHQRRFLARFREHLHRCGRLPASFRSNAFQLMGLAAAGSKDPAVAREALLRVLETCRGRAPAADLRRARSLVDNFFEKLSAARGLLADLTRPSGGAPGRRAGSAGKLAIEDVVLDPDYLTLYPTRDYHDYRKGAVSGDCTSQAALAAEHLCHPAFFNVRVFRGSSWVGNAYCLDLRGPHRFVLLDKVQIPEAERLLPRRLLADFWAALMGLLGAAGARVVAPLEGLSNLGYLRGELRVLVAGRPTLRAELSPAEACFEASRAGAFAVLADGGGGASGSSDRICQRAGLC